MERYASRLAYLRHQILKQTLRHLELTREAIEHSQKRIKASLKLLEHEVSPTLHSELPRSEPLEE
jgi:hypothetical protein